LNSKEAKIVVFSDLDGTLLDENYDFQKSKPVIDQLLGLKVPIVFCSSKTEAEIEFYRKKLGIADPFISENGSAIFIPRGYFQFNYSFTRQTEKYNVIELGTDYSVVREKLDKVKKSVGVKIVGFGDMTEEEIAEDSGLPLRLARLAKRRQFDEPFRIMEGNEKEVLDSLVAEGLRYTKGGRYFHVMGDNDKGKAATILKGLYARGFSELVTFGLGDGPNDLSMLEVVDVPILVRREASCETKFCVIWRELFNRICEILSPIPKSPSQKVGRCE